MRLYRSKRSRGTKDVGDGKGRREADKYMGWRYITGDVACDHALLCGGRHNNHVPQVFNFLYCWLDEHRVMHHPKYIVLVKQYKECKLFPQGGVHLDRVSDLVRGHFPLFWCVFDEARLVRNHYGVLLHRVVE